MTLTDFRGLAVTGADSGSLTLYEQATAELQLYRADPVATIEAAVTAAPGFAMAHVMKAWLHLLPTEAAAIPVARAALAEAARTAATERERGHVAAISHLLDGRWHAAGRVLEDVSMAWPRDVLALVVGHQIDFFTGRARMLRDRIARVLPHWEADLPNRHAIYGMHAFGLEECGDYARAEAQGRRAVEAERRDAWAQHAVAHVMEMQNRTREGIAWMEGNVDGWAGDSFFQVHNWWHLALYHLEGGDIARVLTLYDDRIGGSDVVLDMVDASAMLWRLTLRGVDVGDRWQTLAGRWKAAGGAGTYAFNDAHAMMACLGAGWHEDAQTILAAQEEAVLRGDDNAAFTRDVGRPICRALVAFTDGDYRTAVELLREVRPMTHRFGGSHAQRDVFDLTLIEAALRSGDAAMAAALVQERHDRRPESPLTRLFVQRAAAMRRTVQDQGREPCRVQ